ncbi:hypothetical protein cypCar_00018265 [Cyprinus carpio]|nr:hypothetical protein cypCar_00018265 [Cyprinus carpio]
MEFFYKNSNISSDEWDQTQLVLVQVVGSICCCFILVANAMIIAAVVTNRRFHYPFYYLLANLAASDFLAGIAYVYLMFKTGKISLDLTVQGYFFRQGLLDTSLSASLINLLVIALERYISIMNWKVHSNLNKRRVTLLIALVWGAFVICWTPGLVVLLLDGLKCERCNVLMFKRWLLLLAVLNSVMNPIIYSYRDEEMWSTIKNLMRCIRSETRRQRSSKANIQRGSGRETTSSLKENTAEDSKVSTQEMLKS